MAIALTPEWISAIGTALAALATLPLWVVSWRAASAAKQSAEAADLSARAAMWIELPLIIGRIGDMLHVTVPVPHDRPYGGAVIDDIPDQYGAVTELVLRNHGRSAARIQMVRVGQFIGKDLPSKPTYTRDYPCEQNMVISPDKSVSIDLGMTVEVTPGQRLRLIENSISIWIYADVAYYDFLDTERACGLAWIYRQQGGEGNYYFAPITGEKEQFCYRK